MRIVRPFGNRLLWHPACAGRQSANPLETVRAASAVAAMGRMKAAGAGRARTTSKARVKNIDIRPSLKFTDNSCEE